MLQDQPINLGRQVVKNLRHNDKLGWTFVDNKTARDGVLNGKYYASLYIPPDFSRKISSIASEDPEKPEIIYTVNEKINAVSPKITQSGVSTIINQVSDNFTKSVGNTIFKKFNEAGITLEKELPNILSFEQKIFFLEKEFSKFNQMGEQLIFLDQKMNELDKRAKMKKKLQMSIPTIERLGDVILQTEEKLPQMKRVLDQLALLQDNLAKLESADDIAANLEQSLIDLKSAIDEAIAMGNAANKTNPEVSFEPAELQAMKRHLQDLENMIAKTKGFLQNELHPI